MSIHDEEVLGKAYDARLMRRLLATCGRTGAQVAVALAAIIGDSVLQLAPPYLMKLAIDRYIAGRRSRRARARSRSLFLAILVGVVRARVRRRPGRCR